MKDIIIETENQGSIIIVGKYYTNKNSNRVVQPVIPDKELGYYKSLLFLEEKEYNTKNLVDNSTVILNPQIFKQINHGK